MFTGWEYACVSTTSRVGGSGGPPVLFISCLKLWTTRSANPLGWYGNDVVCFIPFSLRKVFNSSAIICGPLSDKICFGSPYLANMSLNVFTVLEAVVEFICTTFNH